MVKLIAEISGNHRGNIGYAKELIRVCAANGADAVKLQAYTPDTITLNARTPDFMVEWKGEQISLHDLYTKAHTPFEWFPELFDYARKLNIYLFASVFDKTSIDMLEQLNCPAYKIASFEIVDTPLIEYAAKTGKQIFISTGMATFNEIERAYHTAKRAMPNWAKVSTLTPTLFHCISAYPATADQSCLGNIQDLISRLHCNVGLSDHTMTNTAAIAATALGATHIEKHVTLFPEGDGPDDHFSITPAQLKLLRQDIDDTRAALSVSYGVRGNEAKSQVFRRSLYFTRHIKTGETITADAFRSVRPGNGISPDLAWLLEGKTAKRDIEPNTPVTEKDIFG